MAKKLDENLSMGLDIDGDGKNNWYDGCWYCHYGGYMVYT